MNAYNYFMIFGTADESRQFEARSIKGIKVISRDNNYTLVVNFKRGTTATEMKRIAGLWNATILAY